MCAQVLPGPGLKFLGEQLLGHCHWLRCESVHSQGEHHITCIGSEVEVWTCHSVFFTVLTEEVNQRIERVLVLLQTEYRANRHRPSATSNDAYWHKFPAVFAESMRSVAEKVIKIHDEQVHVVRHPEDVPVNPVSVHSATRTIMLMCTQAYLRRDSPSTTWNTSSKVSPNACRACNLVRLK